MAIYLGKKNSVQEEALSRETNFPQFSEPAWTLSPAERQEQGSLSHADSVNADVSPVFPEEMLSGTRAALQDMPPTKPAIPTASPDIAIDIQDEELQRYAGEPLESILIALGAKREYVREALKRKNETHEPLPVIVRDMGLVSQEMVAKAIAYHTGYEYFSLADAEAMDLADVKKLQEVIDNISKFHYSGYILVGFNNKGGVRIAVDTQERVNEARNLFFDYQPSIVIASGQTILKIYRKHFANTESAFKTAIAAYHQALQRGTLTDEPGLVFRVIGTLLRHACYAGASDIFIWATRKVGQIGLKIDGKGSIFTVLKNETFDSTMELLISSCGLTETIKLGPQEAKIEFSGSPPDIRAEFDDIFGRFHFRMEAVMSPTGKKNVVIRINDGQSTENDFSSLPFDAASREIILKNVHAPTGLVLITGPTGSGKTTTMYSILREINPIHRRVFTVENPVEYHNGMWIQHELPRPKMDGNKRQTEGDVGREYLKALLREAPDVILWGEVRDDHELVKTLLAAANTGHLVFTSLHTNSAPKAVLRLLELGANRDALASVLRLVIAQRLVAKLCDYCKIPDTRAETARTFKEQHIHQFKPFVAVGCPHCGDFGYRGRQMIYEIMPANNVRQLIEEGASISKIEQEGVPKTDTIWYRGLNLVAEGVTSMDELMIRAERG
ncbi:MAG: GspE/PulE family protein [Burkholderiales bacterium]